MRLLSLTSAALMASLLQPTNGQLNLWAKKAGLKYFGSATDSPGQRERAGYEDKYPRYDVIFANNDDFSQTTPTNGQKMQFIQATEGVYNFTEGEVVTKLARKQKKLLRCHTLAYWASVPMWFWTKPWTKETLAKELYDSVYKVARHYSGQCYAWDVVNEALNNNGTYHESIFYQVLGEDWIKIAFRAAAKADPHAKLYYNDAGIEVPGPKLDGVIRIIRMLRDAGLRIDGVGFQSHLTAGEVAPIDDYITAMNLLGRHKVEVALTELDIGIIPPITKETLAWQRKDYKTIVGACVQARSCIGITLWDFYDPFSWLPLYTNRTEGTLWFEDFTRHPAYFGAIDALKNGTCEGNGRQRGIEDNYCNRSHN